MNIYRIQDIHGVGPYWGKGSYEYDFLFWWACQDHGYLPTPQSDGLIMLPGNICGFVSIDQLENWFLDAEITKLLNHGYVIKEVTIDQEFVQSSESQAVIESSKIINSSTLCY